MADEGSGYERVWESLDHCRRSLVSRSLGRDAHRASAGRMMTVIKQLLDIVEAVKPALLPLKEFLMSTASKARMLSRSGTNISMHEGDCECK